MHSRRLAVCLLASGLSLLSCDASPGATADAATAADASGMLSLRPRAEPIEFVGLEIERPVTAAEFTELAGRIFGDAAAAGQRVSNLELQPGITLDVAADPRTADQVVVSMQLTAPGESTPRTVLRVPASFQYGRVFIDTVRAALAEADAQFARDPHDAEPFHLEYNATSARGGHLTLMVSWEAGQARLTFRTENPRTSLTRGSINRQAFDGEPFETLSGTVNFHLSRDQFAFFTTRAYGITSGAAQNFRDFQLVPHNWLRITVDPRLQDQVVDVGFEVVTLDGRRIPFARAPASYIAGDQFQQTCFRLMDNMLAAEARRPGSSTAFSSPFYYDDPNGGGVVSVIISGRAGVFSAAYAVEAPARRLRDVDFVPYTSTLQIPATLPVVHNTCADLGSADALAGRFRVKFNASSTVRRSANLDGPLRGNIWGDVYRASDVTITGPRDGARAVASFHYENVDITDPANLREYEIPADLPAGTYQLLGFMDIDGNAVAASPGPDTNDPVTIPIGSYPLQCAVQPITMEFALLLPAGR
ncbi:MAG: hypothetical protein JWM10_4257 [Myxococcaceae bacterium]|nr:hypothetical protein [Myxococcaceae bacterium]